jgi:hypothetical protein
MITQMLLRFSADTSNPAEHAFGYTPDTDLITSLILENRYCRESARSRQFQRFSA